jgi:hypothetical protein
MSLESKNTAQQAEKRREVIRHRIAETDVHHMCDVIQCTLRPNCILKPIQLKQTNIETNHITTNNNVKQRQTT